MKNIRAKFRCLSYFCVFFLPFYFCFVFKFSFSLSLSLPLCCFYYFFLISTLVFNFSILWIDFLVDLPKSDAPRDTHVRSFHSALDRATAWACASHYWRPRWRWSDYSRNTHCSHVTKHQRPLSPVKLDSFTDQKMEFGSDYLTEVNVQYWSVLFWIEILYIWC